MPTAGPIDASATRRLTRDQDALGLCYLFDYWQVSLDDALAGISPPNESWISEQVRPCVVEAWRAPRSYILGRLRTVLEIRRSLAASWPDDLLLIRDLAPLARIHRIYFEGGHDRTTGPLEEASFFDPRARAVLLAWFRERPLPQGHALVHLPVDVNYAFSIVHTVKLPALLGS